MNTIHTSHQILMQYHVYRVILAALDQCTMSLRTYNIFHISGNINAAKDRGATLAFYGHCLFHVTNS